MTTEYLELGAIGIVFALAIKEFFAFLKAKKSPNGNVSKDILGELQLMNSNHLNTICHEITDGNNKLIQAIHEDNMKIVELLGEINGKLNR